MLDIDVRSLKDPTQGLSTGPPLPKRQTFLTVGSRAVIGLAVVATGALAGCGAPEPLDDAPAPLQELATRHQLPVEVNDRVTRWMERFVGDQRHTFEQFLFREGLYGDMIRGKLRDRGMPEDLIYLAAIESGFRPRATSSVEAAGVWQFMGPTARAYGLRVDQFVDERRDPVRATDAALDYLEELHGRFGSWYLAAAGYNAGPTRVARLLRRHADARSGDEQLYWEIIDHLPRETREYVPRLIAATLLARSASDLGFVTDTEAPYAFDRVWVPGGTRLSEVARGLDVPIAQVQDLNPHLIRSVTPPGGSYAVRVPRGRSAVVVAALNGSTTTRMTDD